MSPVATEDITFALALSSDASGMPPLAGKTITVSFGDGTSANSTTDGAGISSVTHVYATAGTYQVTATFASDSIADYLYSVHIDVPCLCVNLDFTKDTSALPQKCV